MLTAPTDNLQLDELLSELSGCTPITDAEHACNQTTAWLRALIAVRKNIFSKDAAAIYVNFFGSAFAAALAALKVDI
jgi:hypothetical protein